MSKRKKVLKITKEDLLKMFKKANRELALENAAGPRGGFHKKSKKDKANKKKNTVPREDYDGR